MSLALVNIYFVRMIAPADEVDSVIVTIALDGLLAKHITIRPQKGHRITGHDLPHCTYISLPELGTALIDVDQEESPAGVCQRRQAICPRARPHALIWHKAAAGLGRQTSSWDSSEAAYAI